MTYTLTQISREVKKERTSVKRIINYLNLTSTEGYHDKGHKIVNLYSECDFQKIQEFLVKHPNTGDFFKKLTCLEKYGVENPMRNNDVKNKLKNTNLIKYGSTSPLHSKLVEPKLKRTILTKYGTEHFNQSDTAKKQHIENNLKKYGVKYLGQRKECIAKRISTFCERLNDEKLELEKKYGELISIQELSLKLKKDDTGIINVCRKSNIELIASLKYRVLYIRISDADAVEKHYDLSHANFSFEEKEIVDFVKSIFNGEILENTKKIINPYELDIYIPSRNLAIEFNGLYWHDENHIDKDYHLNKTILCRQKEIDLIHVFEDDWNYKKDIVKSMIASRLGIYNKKYFARKLSLREVDNDSAKEFYNKNHLQGYTKSCRIHLGLFDDLELIQCMSFNLKGFHDGNVELVRMATKLNTQVVGGFSRIFNNFTNIYNCNHVVSYIYNAWFNGKGYLKSGFEIENVNPPSYYYIVNGVRVHRSQYRRSEIEKKFNRGELFYWNPNETEKENMIKNNINRIYDCGTTKVSWKKRY